jgi:DNA-binding Lrp family transcriptional regulator
VAVRRGVAGTGCVEPVGVDVLGADVDCVVALDAPLGKSGVEVPAEVGPLVVLPVPSTVLEQPASTRAGSRTATSRRLIVTCPAFPGAAPVGKRLGDFRRRSRSLCQAGRVPDGDKSRRVDDLDARLLRELDESPRAGVLELSRRLGVARGTVQARLDRLVQRGVIATFAPVLDPVALGYSVTAFATLEIRQGRGQVVLDHLRGIPEVLEVHTITGPGDMLCRVVARSNDDLQHVLDRVTEFPEIVRTSTVIALSNPVRHRVLPLV